MGLNVGRCQRSLADFFLTNTLSVDNREHLECASSGNEAPSLVEAHP